MKHKKLFYVPGMISLVVLPFLCLLFFYSNKSFESESGMNVGYEDKEGINSFETKYNYLLKRKFTEFNFNGSLQDEKNKLDCFALELRKQNKLKDTINGIKLFLGTKMKYEVYIKILDILTVAKTPTFIDYKNKILIVNSNPKKKKLAQNSNRVSCDTQYVMYLEKLKLEKLEKEKQSRIFLISFFKQNWYLYLAYIFIAFLNVYILLKFNRNGKYNQKSYL